MNIILLKPHEIDGDRLVLRDYRAEHIVKVLRSNAGDRITVGIIDGKTGHAVIEEIDRKRPFQVKLFLTIDKEPPPPSKIDIVLALPRPIVFKRIIHQLTALGVGRVHVINAARVEKSYWESSVVTDNGWKDFVITGLEQAVDTRMVPFSFHRGFKPFMTDTLPLIKARYEQMLVAHPKSETPVSDCIDKTDASVLIAIGPEGGWNEFEMDLMNQQGFLDFNIGGRILKVETAVTAIHAQISLLLEMASKRTQHKN